MTVHPLIDGILIKSKDEAGTKLTITAVRGPTMSYADPPWEIKDALAAIDETAVGFGKLGGCIDVP
ncbi:hypothetical protein [Bacillus sp. T33-2]|uniref:hypothetical protein n=1 Tax=Bacillus sp. T33-2 TaxID=2054168 RepID=UPI000C75B9F9|nr:hypothetical protein [Bacillus sp. T33-2]PLR94440.1 hypothetical protein CVD19_17275 [Bacillus sp. T33-2]